MNPADAPILISPNEIIAAHKSIDEIFLNTPVLNHPDIDAALGCTVTMKLETFNPIRSFKGRGTEAVIARLNGQPNGVTTMSTGNFGQGIARAARRRNMDSTIFVPEDANPLKVEAMRRLGADVRLVPLEEGDGMDHARRFAVETGAALIEDGGDRNIAAGAGGIALELSEAGIEPDVIVIQVGDGALAAGIGSWIRAHHPRTRIVGVAPEGAQAMAQSYARGHVVLGSRIDTIADGMGTLNPFEISVHQLRACLDDLVLLDDHSMVRAGKLLFNATGLLAEAAGAAGLATIAVHPHLFAGKSVVTIITGSNFSPEFKRLVLDD
ncbi:hypothetical protein ASD00_31360 [Ensifer sp. Root31]|uniref:threonine ammonia-lyase n=1 Tax=Ensifer sp. Root31 TaxID=1736512 RepID=UPI00071466B5|nr:pyridoxal-phosphate dependent enzyme [Ensifer sp. Root31]KQU86388.1 hypothetical protein ASD00_31360 [Ensifer sp. Root31]